MTKQEILELMERFAGSGLGSMRLTTQEVTLELTRGDGAALAPAPVASAAVPEPVQETGHAVKAPLVGTFFAAPAPGEEPFVTPGKRVKKGETVCLIEAMKMMSEIAAPCDCVIQEVLKGNGELVAFGDALVRYQPC
jgi:acetyl-CoA carboxylase biotin carboxyl carrier protein